MICGRALRRVTAPTVPWRVYKKNFKFSIVSYNVLSQKLLENNKYLYRGINERYLKSDRTYRIMDELDEYDADIVCLQEFDHQNLDIFAKHFGRKGYEQVFERKPLLPFQEKDDGCFMMFKSDKFKLLRNESLGLFKPHERFLDKPNCAQIIVLECSDGSKVCIANTHLLYNPRRGDIKLAQLSLILHNIQRVVNPGESCGGMPVVFVGDFNTCPQAPLYNMMKYGKLQYSDYMADKISGQKTGGKKAYTIPPGLWCTEELGYHEHGLVERTDAEIHICNDIYRAMTHGVPHPAAAGLTCYKCSDLLPYRYGGISHNLNFKSSYPHTDESGAKEITTYIQNDARTVDYIWYTNNDNTPQNCAHGHSCNTECRESVLLCDATRRLLTKPELSTMGRLPNEKYGSDHQAVQSWFTMYNEPEM